MLRCSQRLATVRGGAETGSDRLLWPVSANTRALRFFQTSSPSKSVFWPHVRDSTSTAGAATTWAMTFFRYLQMSVTDLPHLLQQISHLHTNKPRVHFFLQLHHHCFSANSVFFYNSNRQQNPSAVVAPLINKSMAQFEICKINGLLPDLQLQHLSPIVVAHRSNLIRASNRALPFYTNLDPLIWIFFSAIGRPQNSLPLPLIM